LINLKGMVIKYIKQSLREKVDNWKEGENRRISKMAVKLNAQATINLTEKVEDPIQKQLAKAIVNKNAEFYLQVAGIQRYEEMSFVDGFKSIVYDFLDRLV